MDGLRQILGRAPKSDPAKQRSNTHAGEFSIRGSGWRHANDKDEAQAVEWLLIQSGVRKG